MTTNHDALREALEPFAAIDLTQSGVPANFAELVLRARIALSQPPAPEQASGERTELMKSFRATGLNRQEAVSVANALAATPTAEPGGEAAPMALLALENYVAEPIRDDEHYHAREVRNEVYRLSKLIRSALSASPAAPVAAKPDERVATAGELVSRGIAAWRNVAEPEQRKQSEMYRELVQGKAKPEPQAQAGEPEVVAIADGTFNCVAPLGMPLITLQSHREAMKQLLEANASYAGRERWWNDRMFELEQRLAKKDAALQACVAHMLIAYGQNSHDMILTGDELRGLHAAITKAEEARK